ncbi:hypothetical protein [Aeromonas caviae]|uniref:hypothetical protein n=1 Tax=Aeromonas caviae TaxID=648 RepID=UPI002B491542|nr:hypothetical protein [Aeromonas caviae]
MNKLNPKSIAENFENEVNKLLEYHKRAKTAFKSTQTAKNDISLLNEQVFLFAAVSFETALSDLYFAYMNKDSSYFMAATEQRIKTTLTNSFGEWYSSRISIPHTKHIKADELYPLLDPRGYNITFQNFRKMISQSMKNLSPAFSHKYQAITPAQRKLADCIKCIRNYMAHRSDSGFDSMTAALSKLPANPYNMLSRTPAHRVNSVGAYLKSEFAGKSRTELYLEEMKTIINAIGC